MRRVLILPLVSLLFACPEEPKQESAKAPPPPLVAKKEGPDWKKAFQHTIRYDAEKKAVVVDVKIEPGYHAYTIGETVGKPMNVAIDDASAYSLAGEVQYPKGLTKDLPIGRSVIVEGSAEIVAPIQKKKGATEDEATGTFRWQVCTDEACDRPRTKQFAVKVP